MQAGGKREVERLIQGWDNVATGARLVAARQRRDAIVNVAQPNIRLYWHPEWAEYQGLLRLITKLENAPAAALAAPPVPHPHPAAPMHAPAAGAWLPVLDLHAAIGFELVDTIGVGVDAPGAAQQQQQQLLQLLPPQQEQELPHQQQQQLELQPQQHDPGAGGPAAAPPQQQHEPGARAVPGAGGPAASDGRDGRTADKESDGSPSPKRRRTDDVDSAFKSATTKTT